MIDFIVGFVNDSYNTKTKKHSRTVNMKININFGNFYQVFSVLACLQLNLGAKSAQYCNAAMSSPDEWSVS